MVKKGSSLRSVLAKMTKANPQILSDEIHFYKDLPIIDLCPIMLQ